MNDDEIKKLEDFIFNWTGKNDLTARLRQIVMFIRQDKKKTPKGVYTDMIERAFREAGYVKLRKDIRGKTIRKTCGNPVCSKMFEPRVADVKRGWGIYCSKSCKAYTQERNS